MIFYYSGCGNSKFIAESLSNILKDKLIFIPEVDRKQHYDYALEEGESIGFIFPVYAWAPPQLVLNFIQKLKFSRTDVYTYMVVTCGDNVGMTEKIFAKAVKEIGLQLQASFCVIMPNTYMIMRGMNLDKPNLAQRKVDNAKRLLPKIAKKNCTTRKSLQSTSQRYFPLFKKLSHPFGF